MSCQKSLPILTPPCALCAVSPSSDFYGLVNLQSPQRAHTAPHTISLFKISQWIAEQTPVFYSCFLNSQKLTLSGMEQKSTLVLRTQPFAQLEQYWHIWQKGAVVQVQRDSIMHASKLTRDSHTWVKGLPPFCGFQEGNWQAECICTPNPFLAQVSRIF